MSLEQYIKCPYCSKTIKNNENHFNICTPNYINEKLLWCFSCGKTNKIYTSSQLAKEDKARCSDCVKNNIINKFEPYDYLYELSRSDKNQNINKQLENAVAQLNLTKVCELLLLNVNLNYVRQDTFFCSIKQKRLLSYNADGSEKPDFDENQPTTPLKLCVFRFSDCLNSESDRSTIIKISEELIKFGASAIEGKEYYESRYGIPASTDGLWYTFYKLLCNE